LGDFVKLDLAAIEELVGICDEIITELEAAQKRARSLADPKGFGDFESARQLAAGFGRKANTVQLVRQNRACRRLGGLWMMLMVRAFGRPLENLALDDAGVGTKSACRVDAAQ